MSDIYINVAIQALWLILKLSILPLAVSLLVGLAVSLFQALTQIQEQTLTFVPKVIATILVIALSSYFMLESLRTFTGEIFRLMLQVSSN